MEFYLTIAAFIMGYIGVLVVVPPILRVAFAKKLFDQNGGRKIHTQIVPPLGGVAIFLGFCLSTIIATNGYEFEALKAVLGGVILMFFIGLKDDLVAISARKKFAVQVVSALIIIFIGNIHFTHLHGFFGIEEISHYVGVPVTLFALIVFINAFNLIDGIDGLASGVSMMVSSFFGVWFYLNGNFPYAIMSFALVGSLAAFFMYNVFGHKNKLFMGDAGSLIVGLIVGVLVIQFNELNITNNSVYAVSASPAVSFAIVCMPLIDMVRVMGIRILKGVSPFSPDNNHLHHRLLALVRTHLQATLIIIASNLLIILLAIYLDKLGVGRNIALLSVVFTGILFSTIPSIILKIIKSENHFDMRRML